MTTQELIASGKWAEKVVTDKGEILSTASEFAEAKAKFLAGSKETRNWLLSAYKKEGKK